MDLIAYNLVTLHDKLTKCIKTLGWNEDYTTSLKKTPDGFVYTIKKQKKI